MTEDEYDLYSAYLMAGTHTLPGRHGFRIPAVVLDQWREHGFAVLRTNSLAKKFGVQRKTMWRTIKSAIDHGFIVKVGETEDGRWKFAPCLERGQEWRAAREGVR